MTPNPTVRWTMIVLLSIVMLFLWNRQISDSPIVKDAAQTVRMGINLAHHGVISMDDTAPFHASDYREPLPVLSAALSVKIVDAVHGAADPDAYMSGQRVRELKCANIFWLALLSGGAFWAVAMLGGSFYLRLAGVVLVNLRWISLHGGGEIDDLLTEIPAAAVLIWASASLMLAFTTRRLAWFVAAGLLLGVSALIKAAILYVFAGLIGVWLVVNLWRRTAGWAATLAREVVILGVAFSCVAAPWMVRNLEEVGTLEISQRAGVVLMYRALHDLMTPTEYLGSFYLWAPHSVQGPIGKILGFTPADGQRHGRLPRLNDDLISDFAVEDLAAEQNGRPDQAISFYREARARRTQAENTLSAAGLSDANAEAEADKVLKRQSLLIFREHPWRHLAASIPFMWRGAFQTFPILVIAILIALRKRRYDICAFALPALGIVLEYALFTHFIPRYVEPANAVANLALLGLVTIFWKGSRSRDPATGA